MVRTIAGIVLNLAEKNLRDPEDEAVVREVDRTIGNLVDHSLKWEAEHGHH